MMSNWNNWPAWRDCDDFFSLAVINNDVNIEIIDLLEGIATKNVVCLDNNILIIEIIELIEGIAIIICWIINPTPFFIIEIIDLLEGIATCSKWVKTLLIVTKNWNNWPAWRDCDS